MPTFSPDCPSLFPGHPVDRDWKREMQCSSREAAVGHPRDLAISRWPGAKTLTVMPHATGQDCTVAEQSRQSLSGWQIRPRAHEESGLALATRVKPREGWAFRQWPTFARERLSGQAVKLDVDGERETGHRVVVR